VQVALPVHPPKNRELLSLQWMALTYDLHLSREPVEVGSVS
jgi:hypothetical protein